jgi:hypothetical protein
MDREKEADGRSKLSIWLPGIGMLKLLAIVDSPLEINVKHGVTSFLCP